MRRSKYKKKKRLPYYWAFIFGILFFVAIKFGLRPAYEAIEWRTRAGERAGHRLVHKADHMALFMLVSLFALGIKNYFKYKRKGERNKP